MTRDEALEQTIRIQARMKNQADNLRKEAEQLDRWADEFSLAVTRMLNGDEAALLDQIEQRRAGVNA